MTTVDVLAHGYIRMEWPDETEIELMCTDVVSYCTLNGYRLGSIFVDRGVSADVFARTGFINLLDEVRQTNAQAVVVPTVEHLSSEAFVQDALKRMVERAKARVLVVCEINGGRPRIEGGQGIGSAPGASS